MEMNPYLNFKGDCEAALTFYAECLAGKLGELFRYGGTPMADQAPSCWENKLMHGSVTIAGQTVMGADVPLEKTFWAQRFGALVDRFGIPWMINCE